MLESLGFFQDALKSLTRAFQINARSDELWLGKSELMRNQNILLQALATYDQAIRLRPNFSLALFHKACLLERLGRWSEAQSLFEQAR